MRDNKLFPIIFYDLQRYFLQLENGIEQSALRPQSQPRWQQLPRRVNFVIIGGWWRQRRTKIIFAVKLLIVTFSCFFSYRKCIQPCVFPLERIYFFRNKKFIFFPLRKIERCEKTRFILRAAVLHLIRDYFGESRKRARVFDNSRNEQDWGNESTEPAFGCVWTFQKIANCVMTCNDVWESPLRSRSPL